MPSLILALARFVTNHAPQPAARAVRNAPPPRVASIADKQTVIAKGEFARAAIATIAVRDLAAFIER